MSTQRTIVIMQPGYIPWLGFFELMDQADTFILYDNVQFDSGGWRNRNKIKTAQGPQWLTVPVLRPFGLKTKINQIVISRSLGWKKKHLASLRQNYSRSPWFNRYYPAIENIIIEAGDSLIDLVMALIVHISKEMGLERQIFLSSQLGDSHDDRIGRLIKLIKTMEGNRFYEPAGGLRYLKDKEKEVFEQSGITLDFQSFNHPVYAQQYGPFLPNLSILDLLFNVGPDSLAVIRNGAHSQ
jgi:hypothetical protein